VESGCDVVDGDVLDADGGAQLCDDALVDLAGDLVDALAVADGEGEVDDRGAAQDADRGVGGAVAEGGFLGQFGDLAVAVPGLYYSPPPCAFLVLSRRHPATVSPVCDHRRTTAMTQPSQTASSPATTSAASSTTKNPLATQEGKISVAESVVQKIAGVACREISGVHEMGASTSRAFGAIRERIPGSSGTNVAQGVGVEVGETQAAIDLDIVVEYGVAIAELGKSIQRNVKQAVERMTGLEVVEVNVNVDDVYLPADDSEQDSPSRVS